MKAAAVDILLAIAVLSVWLGTIGFVRLKTALDRLHCAAFANVAAGVSLTLAVVLSDGMTSRSCKAAALLIMTLLVGAATSHAIGRALYLRGGKER